MNGPVQGGQTGRIARRQSSISGPPSRYRIARSATTVFVQPEGMANLRTAPLLHAFLSRARDDGARSVYVDLSVCTGMDSTFMGLLVGQAQSFAESGGRLAVVKPNELCSKLLTTLGVDQVVTVVPAVEVPTVEFVDMDSTQAISDEERTRLVRKAHQDLAALNEANKAKFAAFLDALDADLAKKPA